MLKVEESMINDNNNDTEMKKKEYSIKISIMIDSLYNMIIYEKYEIGFLFEWIMSHLKENHEIKTQIVDIMRYLNMMKFGIRVTCGGIKSVNNKAVKSASRPLNLTTAKQKAAIAQVSIWPTVVRMEI